MSWFSERLLLAALTLVSMQLGSSLHAETAEPSLRVKQAMQVIATLTDDERADLVKQLAKTAATIPRPTTLASAVTPQGALRASGKKENGLDRQTPQVLASGKPSQDPATNAVPWLCAGPIKDMPKLVPLLRKDWVDIGFESCPQPVDKATGATISYSHDYVKHDAISSITGTAGLLYNLFNTRAGYATTGGYVTVNQVANSAVAQASSNADTLAYGGLFEFGSINETDDYHLANYVRIRGGGVEDHIRQTTAGSVTFEWLPDFVNADQTIHIHDAFNPIPGQSLLMRFDPALLAQYDSIVGGKKTLAFNNMNQSLRVGPQLTLAIYPGTSEFFSHFVGSVTYHWAYETYSGRPVTWFDSSLTYNLDRNGNFGLTGTYQHGNDENTGVFASIYKISLTGKI